MWAKMGLPAPLSTWATRIGKANEIWAMPCKPTPELWVKAAWHVIPVAIFKAIKPSPVDYLIIRFGFSHHKARRKVFDFWDFEFLPQVPKSGIQWQVFKLGGLAARALWYIAVFDAFTWGVVNWMSLAYQWAGCSIPGNSFGASNYNPGITFLPTTPAGFLNNWLVEGYHGAIVASAISMVGSVNPYGIGFTCTFGQAPGHELEFGPPNPSLRGYPSGSPIVQPQHSVVTNKLASYSFFMPEMPTLVSWAWGVWTDAPTGYSVWSGGSFSAYANLSTKDLLPDP